jgi:Spy/CpxP family protein refolding chaperone
MPRQGDQKMTRILATLAVLTLAPAAAEAQTYRCVSKDGKRYYGSTIPHECYGMPVEQLNSQGMLVRRIDPEGTEKARLAKDAADAKKREEDAAAREAGRRNRALLATYTSEKDIDEARARALAENSKAIKEVESTLEAVRKRQAGYGKELEFYKGKNEAPAKLRDDIKNAEDELKAQQQLLEAKKRETDSINARFDDDKKRYAALGRPR